MKKCMLALIMLVMVCGFIQAANKGDNGFTRHQVFGDVGIAVSDLKNIFLDFGWQYYFRKDIALEVLVDYYTNPDDTPLDITLLGFNLNGVYKANIQEKLDFFAKGGVNITRTTVSGSAGGWTISASHTDFGLNAGAGLEYLLSKGFGLRLGGTFKILFTEEESTNWFKFYAGVLYRF